MARAASPTSPPPSRPTRSSPTSRHSPPSWSSPRSIDADPVALSHILDAVVDTPREALAKIDVPTLVNAGADDTPRGSVEALAAVLPNGRLLRVPGDHLTALLGPGFADAVAAFLAAGDTAS